LGASARPADVVISSSATEGDAMVSNEEAWTEAFTESSATTVANNRRSRPVAPLGGGASAVGIGVIARIVAPIGDATDGRTRSPACCAKLLPSAVEETPKNATLCVATELAGKLGSPATYWRKETAE
jgi:hypothetical protein